MSTSSVMILKQIAELERRKKIEAQWDAIRNDKHLAKEFAINDFVKESTQFDGLVDLYNQACAKLLGHQNKAELTPKMLDDFIGQNTDFKNVFDLETKFLNHFNKNNKGA